MGEILVEMRNAFQGCVEAIDGFLTYLSQLTEPDSVKEETFTALRWEPAKARDWANLRWQPKPVTH